MSQDAPRKKRERLASKPIPVARSIPWKPLDDSYHVLASMLAQSGDNFVLFATQEFLRATEERAASPEAANDRMPLGLMLGRLYRCPKTELRYGVIDDVQAIPPGLTRDNGRPDVQKVRQFVKDSARGERRVLGWFAARDAVGPRLPLPDERLHAECFPESWQAALVVVPSVAYSAGGFFRYTLRAQRTCQVPFYELVGGAAPKGGERKRTVIEWSNYVTSDTVLRPGAVDETPANGTRAKRPSVSVALGEVLSRVRGLAGGNRDAQ